MEVGKLVAEVRTTGKANLSRVRRAGKIPAVVYGGGLDPIAIAVDPTQLLKALDPVKKTNTVIELKLPTGIKALAAAGQTVCACTAPKAEKVEEVAAPVEGAVAGAPGAPAAAGAPGAAAAPGAPGAAPPAGAAPAKEDKKKK